MSIIPPFTKKRERNLRLILIHGPRLSDYEAVEHSWPPIPSTPPDLLIQLIHLQLLLWAIAAAYGYLFLF